MKVAQKCTIEKKMIVFIEVCQFSSLFLFYRQISGKIQVFQLFTENKFLDFILSYRIQTLNVNQKYICLLMSN